MTPFLSKSSVMHACDSVAIYSSLLYMTFRSCSENYHNYKPSFTLICRGADTDFSFNGKLDDVNQCSLITLIQWLAQQPFPLQNADCRIARDNGKTDIFFQVNCGSV